MSSFSISSLAQENILDIVFSWASFLSLREWMSSSQVVIIWSLRSSSAKRLLLASSISLPMRCRSVVLSKISSLSLAKSSCLSLKLCSCGFFKVKESLISLVSLCLSSVRRDILDYISPAWEMKSAYLFCLISSYREAKSGFQTDVFWRCNSTLLALSSVSNFRKMRSFCNISCSQYFSSSSSSLCSSSSFTLICEMSLFFMMIISCCLRSMGQQVFSF